MGYHDPALIAATRDSLAAVFGSGLATALPAAADTLESSANGAQDKDLAKRRREAGSELYRMKGTLPARVVQEVSRCFDAKINPSDGFSKTARFSLDSLTLVDDHQMQEEIALGHAAKRLKEHCDYDLFALSKRLTLLTGKEYGNVEASPVYTTIFVRGLLDALTATGCPAESRLPIFEALAPQLADIAQDAYVRTNRMLVERHVDVEISSPFGKPVIRADRPAVAPHTVDEQVQQALAGLLSKGTTAMPGVAVPEGVASVGDAGANGVLVQVRPELLDALRRLDASLDAEPPPAAEPANVVRDAKATLQSDMTSVDVVVADIVAAMFDRLFADARIPSSIKAQVGRLQIPILKLAMRDRSVFSDPQHVVRLLIDGMAEFGIAHGALFEDGMPSSQSIAAITEDIARDHSANPDIFTHALKRLNALMAHHDEIAIGSDEVIMGLEDSERRELAIAAANYEVRSRVEGRDLPVGISAFLLNDWRDLLVQDYLSGGSAGEPWRLDIATLNQLIGSLARPETREERQQLAKMLPSLIELLKDVIERSGTDPLLADQMFEELHNLHTTAASGAREPYGIKSPPPVHTDDPEATEVLPSSILYRNGLARGSWVEFVEPTGQRSRARVTWISTAKGTSLFKNYDENRSFAVGINDLLKRLEAGTASIVEGVGVARASIEGAIREVAERVQPAG